MIRKPFHIKFARLNDLLGTIPGTVYQLSRNILGLQCYPELYYVVPQVEWSTDWDGRYITQSIAQLFEWRTHITSMPQLLTGHVIHYGELGAFLLSLGWRCNLRNTVVTTIFHGSRNKQYPDLYEAMDRMLENVHMLARIVVSCKIMENRLITYGVPKDKVACIPLGVDLTQFQPPSKQQRLARRRELAIPDDAICIGSFQKDGIGWGDGLTPKLIKGPDIFIEVIAQLRMNYKIFILLSGPARGYIKQNLDALGVPYHHKILSDYLKIPKLYHCLDLYLVTSREEGGPKPILESMATGVPLVSTKVGMAPDIIQHGVNGLLGEQEDVESLVEHVKSIIENPDIRRTLIANGLRSIEMYDWHKIATRYYQQVYLPLLQSR